MKMKARVLALVLASPATGWAVLPLADGEGLTYRVNWGILPAGQIQIEAEHQPESSDPRMRVTTTTATSGPIRLFLRFDAKGESLFDPDTGRLLFRSEESVTRGRRRAHTVEFDYERSIARYLTPEASEEPRDLPMPEGEPLDLVMGLLDARLWDLAPGDQRDVVVLFDDEFYELTVHAEGYEDIDTPLGQFHTLLLNPRMEKTEPKGMFRRGSTVKLWISQDEEKLPVRFMVEFRFGSGVATLTEYRPPRAEAPATEPASVSQTLSPPEEANLAAANPRS